MKFKTRQQAIDFLTVAQRSVCCYDPYKNYPTGKEPKAPNTCDCKYGTKLVGLRYEEQNGCPEFRELRYLLTILTDKEYERLLSRIEKERKKQSKEAAKRFKEISKQSLTLKEEANAPNHG